MKAHFYVAGGKEREESLALSLKSGIEESGDTLAVTPIAEFDGIDPSADVCAVFGLKGRSREVIDAYRDAGKNTLMFDKALIRVPGAPHKHLRVCINDVTALKTLMRKPRRFERWESLRIELKPRRQSGPRDPIILALSSQKYCDFFGLGDANDYARDVVAAIRQHNRKRPIIYRPKPSFTDFVPIEGTILSRRPEYLEHLLPSAYALVTHGSSAAIDALISGVPTIALGDCAATPVAGRTLDVLNDLPFPSDHARWQFFVNLAHCQYSVDELVSGEAWRFIRKELRRG